MKGYRPFAALLGLFTASLLLAESFVPSTTTTTKTLAPAVLRHFSTSSSDQTSVMASEPHPFCQLPGDPSLILTTNVDLGDKKMEIMKCT